MLPYAEKHWSAADWSKLWPLGQDALVHCALFWVQADSEP